MNTFQSYIFYSISCLLLLNSCKSDSQLSNNLPDQTLTENGVHVVIEIPAGTNKQKDDDQLIDFLPYPGNFGYIHNTLVDTGNGGDGEAMDVLVIAENLPAGTHLEVIPIAALILRNKGAIDTKIIGVPSDSDLQIIDAEDFSTLFMRYNAAFEIIEKWFINYKGIGQMELISWQDEKKAMAEIVKWQVENEE